MQHHGTCTYSDVTGLIKFPLRTFKKKIPQNPKTLNLFLRHTPRMLIFLWEVPMHFWRRQENYLFTPSNTARTDGIRLVRRPWKVGQGWPAIPPLAILLSWARTPGTSGSACVLLCSISRESFPSHLTTATSFVERYFNTSLL